MKRIMEAILKGSNKKESLGWQYKELTFDFEEHKPVMFSSETDLWATPQEFFNELDKEFNFDLDPCATHENAKCDKHFTVIENGLKQDWGGYKVFCNPPYGKAIKDWVKKCYEESLKANTTVVMLIPARSDTKYQHEYIFPYAKAILFIKGRLKFSDCNNSAPFPSQLVIYDNNISENTIKVLERYGYLIILR